MQLFFILLFFFNLNFVKGKLWILFGCVEKMVEGASWFFMEFLLLCEVLNSDRGRNFYTILVVVRNCGQMRLMWLQLWSCRFQKPSCCSQNCGHGSSFKMLIFMLWGKTGKGYESLPWILACFRLSKKRTRFMRKLLWCRNLV